MSRDQQFNWNPASFNIRPETFASTRQMSVAMLEHCRTLWALQLDTLDHLTGETARQFRQALQGATNHGPRPNQWPEQFYQRSQKFVEIARGWLDMSSQATTEINQLWGQTLSASLRLGETKPATYPQQERRIGAVVISFADRRRSAHQSKAGTASASRPSKHRNSG